MKKKKYLLFLFAVLLVVLVISRSFSDNKEKTPKVVNKEVTTKTNDGNYEVTELVTGLEHPWGIGFLPSGEIIFTERVNKISLLQDMNVKELNAPNDTYVNGEGGMLDVAVDPEFDENAYVYLCFNSKVENEDPQVIVARFELDIQQQELKNRIDIVDGIPANPSGRHSGCRLGFGPEKNLWIGTGDTARQEVPQDSNSLGGKVLRVDRNGNSVEGNLGGDFDPRIFSYGHRNIQGLSFFKNEPYKDLLGVTMEHGPDVDDEVNLIVKGNFGWDPLPYYGEGVPMTDKDKFPEAVDAIWSSGYPTIAASGGTVINSSKWGEWQNSIAVAALKGSHIRILDISEDGEVTNEEELFKNEYGRFRTIQESPDGKLYMLTDNGEGRDKIIVLSK